MKSTLKLTVFFLAFICFSCSNSMDKTQENQPLQTVKYQCPKKCEGDKTCVEPLTCPVCNEGMEIIVVAKKPRK